MTDPAGHRSAGGQPAERLFRELLESAPQAGIGIQNRRLQHVFVDDQQRFRTAEQRLDAEVFAIRPGISPKFGYRRRTELEPALLEAQEAIRRADHLVFVYPTWWGTMPAVLKGFIDRVFPPGFDFKYRDGSPLWDKLLKGKSARLIVTMDTPSWYNRWVYWRAGHLVMKRNVLRFCGISPVRVTEMAPVKDASEQRRADWLDKAERLGRRLS